MSKSFLIETYIDIEKEYKVLTQKDFCNNVFHTDISSSEYNNRWKIIENFEKHTTTDIQEAFNKHLEYIEELKKFIKQKIKKDLDELINTINQVYSEIELADVSYDMEKKISFLKSRVEIFLRIIKKYEEVNI